MNSSAYANYKTSSVQTGTPVQQIIFIFDEVIKILYQAVKSREEGDLEGEYNLLSKAADIFDVLRSDVDINQHQLLKDFYGFYSATLLKIDEINAKNQGSEEVNKLIDSVRDIRDTIYELSKQEEEVLV